MRLFAVSLSCILLWHNASAIAQEKWGTIKGRIVWDGDTIPEPEDLTPLVKKYPDADFCLKEGRLLDEKWVIDPKSRGIRWTFVWLSNGDPKLGNPLPIHPALQVPANPFVEINIPLCSFVPHAVGVHQGQQLVVKNTSPVTHNLLHAGPAAIGNGLLQPGKQLVINNLMANRAPEAFSCSIHPWMRGYVRVFNHPYFEVTGEDGAFEIQNAPAGRFNLIVWHPYGGYRFGARGRQGEVIEIDANRVKDLGELRFPSPKVY